MVERTKIFICPERCIREQLAYIPDMVVYPNYSDMKELVAIGVGSRFKKRNKNS